MVYNGNKKFINENYLLCALDLSLQEIDKISEGNEILMDFRKAVEKINDDEDFVNWDYQKEVKKIENTFRQEGYDAGKIEVAKNLLSAGVAEKIVSQSTGLSIEEINNLK